MNIVNVKKSVLMSNYFLLRLILLIFILISSNETLADIPFRVSIKFIVDSSGDRPSAGSFNTDDEVNAQELLANEILVNMFSELRMKVTEIIDLPTSLSTYSGYAATSANRDTIRSLAMASPTTWKWRTNAVNVYVVGGSGSAFSKFPPDNDIVIMGQSIFDTTLLHELGHSLNLKHTHQDGGADGCNDTLADDKDWNNKDQMANNSYGSNYSLLSTAQKNAVDMTWKNLMSYHQPRSLVSPCQKDRMSSQASIDSNLLTVIPRYVHGPNSIACTINIFVPCNGTWSRPYSSLQNALDGSGLSGKAIVLEKGNHLIIQSGGINLNVDLLTRQGVSKVDRERTLYELPVALDKSKNLAVKDAMKAAKRESTLARKALKEGEKNAAASKADKRNAIKKLAKEKSTQHKDNVIYQFLEAEKYATDKELVAIQMELAERYWHSQNYSLCLEYYNRVAANTVQIHLKDKAIRHAQQCQDKLDPEPIK